ncbi:metal ABC transporter solute-binding protein, Zn/Mn family [Pseudolysinimonas sp.]|jgi:zinc/manganese transport system substrate-binding protein|uniref:metal ABC transporter solute-binding protein, Zn/Mn family n=1 Tax=Pseudolysinimonas sp. TaxID=2680009 RepID=UPI0037830576
MSRHSLPALTAATVLAAAGLAGCAASPASDDSALTVVASTNVYGDIAARIAGSGIEVRSIITSAAQDPHSYEASAQDQLAVSDADLVIQNGGGYDAFMETLLDASGNDSVLVLDAVEISGLAPEGDDEHAEEEHADEDEHADEEHAEEDGHDGHDHIEGFNEHVWYSFEAMDALAEEIAEHLGELDAANAATYTANYESFATDLAALEERAHELHEGFEGTGVAITEPVPLYLLAELGFDNLTPDEFSEAIEEGTDVPPLVLDETLELFRSGAVGLLAYNEQTAGAETEEVRAAAEAAGIPVVSFTETLPDGADYLSWMTDNIDAVANALS